MAAPYFQNTAVANINALFTELRSQLIGVTPTAWAETIMNSSTVLPAVNAGQVSRESIFQLPTNTTQENQIGGGFIAMGMFSDNSGSFGLMFQAFTAMKTVRTIATAVRAANVTTVTTTAPHGFATGDIIFLNGVLDITFNKGFPGAATAISTITVTGASTFTYPDVAANASSTGGSCTAVYNVAANRRPDDFGSGSRINLLNAAMTVYGYRDAFRICGIVQQSGQNRVFYIGHSGREHVQSGGSSCAVAVGAIAVGVNVITMDRIPAFMYVGQPLWIISPDAATNEVAVVSALAGAVVTFTAANAYSAGAKLGWDPVPLMVMAPLANSATTAAMESYIVYMCLDLDGGRTGTQINPTDTSMAFATDVIDFQETITDPDSAGYYQAVNLALVRASAPEGTRKYLPGFIMVPLGPQTEFQIHRVGGVPVTDDYKVFVSQTSSGAYVLAIGPGATNP